MSFLTLLDIQKRNGSESDIGLIEEVGRSAPEVTQLASVVGDVYKRQNQLHARSGKRQHLCSICRTLCNQFNVGSFRFSCTQYDHVYL